jgi:hypothetical protein
MVARRNAGLALRPDPAFRHTNILHVMSCATKKMKPKRLRPLARRKEGA